MKDPALIICRCGRIRKYGTWVWIVNPLSDFIQKLIEGLSGKEFSPIKDDKIQITVIFDKCDKCQREGGKNESKR